MNNKILRIILSPKKLIIKVSKKSMVLNNFEPILDDY